MDKYKYKARRTDNNEWVEGYYMVINIDDMLIDVIFTGPGYTLDKMFMSHSWREIDRDTLTPLGEGSAHWIIEDGGFGGDTYACSYCGARFNDIYYQMPSKVCPSCFKNMEEWDG